MRPLEWMLFLSFLPILLLPLIPQASRRVWLFVGVLLPVLAGALHAALEGWRTPMIPLYGMILLVLLCRMPALPGREAKIRRRRGMLISLVSAMLLVAGGLIAGWALPVLMLPAPTGPYAVGIADRELTDAARGRRLMVSVWYPATQSSIPAPLTHDPDETMTALSNLTGLPAPLFQHLRYTSVAASENVPVLTDKGSFPVLVFSHGMVGLRMQNSSTFQELASWGYIVVAIDHTDAAAVTVFPDGEARFYDLARFGIPADVEPDKALMTEHVLPVWIADQRFVYDTLEDWTVNDPLFAGMLDITHIGSFGHSFGGATALEVCRIEARCKAAANLDGGLYGEIIVQPATRPLLLMTSEGSRDLAEPMAEWGQMIGHAESDVYWLELPHSTHLSFTITQMLSPILVPQDFDPRAGLQTVDTYVRAFFDAHLRDMDVPLLEPMAEDTAVRWLNR